MKSTPDRARACLILSVTCHLVKKKLQLHTCLSRTFIIIMSFIVKFTLSLFFQHFCNVWRSKFFVNLKSNLALNTNKGHNLLKRVFLVFYYFHRSNWLLPFEMNALFVLPPWNYCPYCLPREFKQPIISSQEDKQGIKFKEGAIKCYKVKKYFPS